MSDNMIITIEVKLKDEHWGFSDLLDGRPLDKCRDEIIELFMEDPYDSIIEAIQTATIKWEEQK
jgi:hypothetical protein